MVRNLSPRKSATANNQHHQGHGKNDQVIANLQHGTLEMADGFDPLHQLRGLAEVGFVARGVDHGVDFALTDNRTGKHRRAGLGGDGQGFAGQRRLVHFNRIALQQARVCRHNVTQPQPDDVARHQFGRIRVDPLPIALHLGFDRQSGLQGLDGVARLVFFPESHDGVGNQQKEDDEKSSQCRTIPDRITAASIIHGMGPQK